jgi:hypothetical protein
MDSSAIHMYPPGMHRSSFLLVMLCLCLHCGGQTQTGPAEEAPTTPAPTEAPAADTGEPPADTGEAATPPAPAETEAPKDTAAPAATSSKPVCAKLPKSDCKVMKGCAWNDKLKCVDEGT